MQQNLFKKIVSNPGHMLALAFFVCCTIIFFYPTFFKRQIPLAGDITLGAYHPWRDNSWGKYNAPYPYKLFEMSDSVNYYYPTKLEIARQIKSLKIPVWNEFVFNGTPLLGDGHSGAVYPLNILLLLGSFNFGWSFFIVIQPLLASFFLYLYLVHHKITKTGSILGGLSFGFGSYFINQVELANIGHTVLWLPLLLLGIDLFKEGGRHGKYLIILSASMMYLAGFFQMFVYCLLFSIAYFIFLGSINLQKVKEISLIVPLILMITAVQWIPFLNFLPHTVRWHGAGIELPVINWLLAPKLLLTFISPDFFGNPATANWTGGFAYYEFVAYSGPFLLVLLCLSLTSSKNVKFFWTSTLVCLLFIVKNPFSLWLYGSNFPLISSLTPSRLLIVVVFSMSILVSYGVDRLSKSSSRFGLSLFAILAGLLLSAFLITGNKHLLLPLFFVSIEVFVLIFTKNKVLKSLSLILLTFLGLYYQGHKYLPFTPSNLVFPETTSVRYLKENLNGYRFLSIHPETLPVNSNMVYGLHTSNGYNPMHEYNYHVQMSNLQFENGEQSFGRTIFMTRINQEILNLTKTKYILSAEEITNPNVASAVKLVHQEGQTRVYEVSTPSASLASGPSQLEKQQNDWSRRGLVITSLGLAIIFLSHKLNEKH